MFFEFLQTVGRGRGRGGRVTELVIYVSVVFIGIIGRIPDKRIAEGVF